jgi:predicted dehydrogenase
VTSGWFPAPQVTPLRGGPTLRWGIVGPGEIADDFAATVRANTDQQLYAVASRSADRAQDFARRHGIATAYGAYDDLFADPDVDIVYVATPHPQHHPLALAAIAAGKHVLVEKPLAVTAEEGTEIAEAACAAGVFAAEAMWTRYLPQFDVLDQVIKRGDLGDIRLATADVGWKARSDDGGHRLFDLDQAGGVSLDMGVYGYWFAQFAIGVPRHITVLGQLGSTGVDVQAVVGLADGQGRLASVTSSIAVSTTGLGSIQGTEGLAAFVEPFVFPASFTVTVAGDVHEWSDPTDLRLRQGLAWQTTAIAQYIHDGLTDAPIHRLDDAIAVLRTIDEVRRQVAAQG